MFHVIVQLQLLPESNENHFLEFISSYAFGLIDFSRAEQHIKLKLLKYPFGQFFAQPHLQRAKWSAKIRQGKDPHPPC